MSDGNVVPGCDAAVVLVEFASELWIWAARRDESWTFVSLPVDASEEIRARSGGLRRGFGSLRVRATVGRSSWTTSVFPDSGRNAYVLPVKRAIRTAESLTAGAVIAVTVELLDL
ncbi:hypothetical protein Axi01nite_13430 [Actinoplanes xinjiangensis]|nr:hypothetical protein Axi01nite_13430 [Actinoplanes xinjiangensis]